MKDCHFEVVGVFTQPDRPKVIGNQLAAPPVKEFALQNNIPVFQPDKIRNGKIYDLISNLKPEAIVVVAYGKILPKSILEILIMAVSMSTVQSYQSSEEQLRFIGQFIRVKLKRCFNDAFR